MGVVKIGISLQLAGVLVFGAGNAVAAGSTATLTGSVTGLSIVSELTGGHSVFAAVDGGLFRAPLATGEWSNIGLSIPATKVHGFYATPSHLYAMTSDGGVFYSGDRGESWVSRNAGLGCLNASAYAITGSIYHFVKLNCEGADRIYRSQDNGLNWAALPDFATGAGINRIIPSGSTAGRIWVMTTNGMFVSPDYGSTWIRPSALSTSYATGFAPVTQNASFLDFTPSTPPAEFILAEGVGAYYAPNTTLASSAFALTNTGLPALSFGKRISVLEGQAHVSVRGHGVYRFANGQWSLTIPDSALPDSDHLLPSPTTPATEWYARTRSNGVWKSSDAGQTWARFGSASVSVPPSPSSLSLPQGELPASAVTLSVSGAPTSLTLLADLKIDVAQAFAAGYKVYVVALLPAGTAGVASTALFTKRADKSWAPLASPLAAYMENVTANSQDGRVRVEILRDTDLTAFRGAEFYIGYGVDDAEMLSARRYRGVYKVD